jgi:hypothetical protein
MVCGGIRREAVAVGGERKMKTKRKRERERREG